MQIKGFYEVDENFITIYSEDNTIYTIAVNTGDWGSRKFSEKDYNQWKASAEEEAGHPLKYGEFTLSE